MSPTRGVAGDCGFRAIHVRNANKDIENANHLHERCVIYVVFE